MRSGDKHTNHHHLLSFHLPHLMMTHKKEAPGSVPKGFMVVRVGQQGEEQRRFTVPVMYLNHPLFARLLKEAEEEYGFRQEGAITIPCNVDYFLQVLGLIDRANSIGNGGGHHFHLLQDLHLVHLSGCFRA